MCVVKSGWKANQGKRRSLKAKDCCWGSALKLAMARMGFKFGRSSSGSSEGGISKVSSKPNTSDRVVQRENSKSMDEGVTFDRGECEGRKSELVQSEPVGVLIGTEFANKESDGYLAYGEQTYHEAQSSVLAIDGVQLARAVSGNGNGCAPTQSGSMSKRGSDEGDAEVEQMEFEGGSEVAATL